MRLFCYLLTILYKHVILNENHVMKNKDTDLSHLDEFFETINCRLAPTNSEIQSSSMAKNMQHLETVTFAKNENVNLDQHSVMITEYHKIGDILFFKGYEVVLKEVAGSINLKNRKDSKLKISKHGKPFLDYRNH